MLCFDILDDFTDELFLSDYFTFLMINEMTYEINYKIVRRVEYYHYEHNLFRRVDGFTIMLFVAIRSDLSVIKWLYYNKKEKIDRYVLDFAHRSRNVELIKWLFNNFASCLNDHQKSTYLLREIKGGYFDMMEYFHHDLGFALQREHYFDLHTKVCRPTVEWLIKNNIIKIDDYSE